MHRRDELRWQPRRPQQPLLRSWRQMPDERQEVAAVRQLAGLGQVAAEHPARAGPHLAAAPQDAELRQEPPLEPLLQSMAAEVLPLAMSAA